MACHVVPEIELSHIHGSAGVPTMTCFVPSLRPGTPFNISIHCWGTLEISPFARAYSEHADLVRFEARILIDGRMVAFVLPQGESSDVWSLTLCQIKNFRAEERLAVADRNNFWCVALLPIAILPSDSLVPQNSTSTVSLSAFASLISEKSSCTRTTGARETILDGSKLSLGKDFPGIPYRCPSNASRTLWHSLSSTLLLVWISALHSARRCTVLTSLDTDILENNGIAWPNPFMWRWAPPNKSLAGSSYYSGDRSESHAHSPRRRSTLGKDPLTNPVLYGRPSSQSLGAFGDPALQMGFLSRGDTETSSALTPVDSFTESTQYFDWLNTVPFQASGNKHPWPTYPQYGSKHSTSDATMSDYVAVPPRPDHMVLSGGSIEDNPMRLKVPTNTPTTGHDSQPAPFSLPAHAANIPADLAASLTNSLLNQPLPIPILPQITLPTSAIKSRKDHKLVSSVPSNPSSESSTPQTSQLGSRKSSQSIFNVEPRGRTASASGGAPSMHNSPSLNAQRIFSTTLSNTPSMDDFGTNITNIINMSQDGLHPSTECSKISSNVPTIGVKRTRAFTPASARAIDEEDEPRRASPLLRLGSLGNQENQKEG